MRISPAQWQALDPLLAQALDLPDVERATWLTDLDRTQPELGPLLRKLLAADARAERQRALDTLAVATPRPARRPDGWRADQLIGRYRLWRPIGQGGMGDVWLARQADGGIQRSVALKLPILVGPAGLRRERFARERDILARLQHPHIATLYDAGIATLPDGVEQPYLAMEYVEGTSLLDHADRKVLSLPDRLRLFRQVLAAVGHAHRQLVIHRDIKPSNILVTGDGEAKLLDFGIAKLIEDDAATEVADELTRVGGRLLTLRYAAPEQATGEALSTATDVYALGVVLHELLTGKSPYRRVRDQGVLRVLDLQQADFVLPSSLLPRHGLEGDLDAILLKALRREPGERYASVDQFDEDLQRHQDRRPVLARRGSRRYRLGRFVARHRLPLAATAATLLSLAVGLAISLQQRHEALVAKARAERHFASVQQLAGTFIYDVDALLKGLAGTLPARQRLAETAVKYLDGLADESAGNADLGAEVAAGYVRMGAVLGGLADGNIGEIDASTAVFEKAARLLDSLSDEAKADVKILAEIESVHTELGAQYYQRRDPRWEAELDKSTQVLRRLNQLRGNRVEDQLALAARLIEIANVGAQLGHPPAVESAAFREGRALLEGIGAEVGTDRKARAAVARIWFRIAESLLDLALAGDHAAEALVAAQRSIEGYGSLVRETPNDTHMALLAEMARGSMVDALVLLGRAKDAELAEAVLIRNLANAYGRDRENVDLVGNLWAAYALGVQTAWLADQPGLARDRDAHANALWKDLPAALRESTGAIRYRFTQELYAGLALMKAPANARPQACLRLRNAALARQQLLKMQPQADMTRFPGLEPPLTACLL